MSNIDLTGLLFGEVSTDCIPELPSGFVAVIQPHDWVFAVGPDQKHWYVITGDNPKLLRRKYATIEDVVRTEGALTLREQFYDESETISLVNILQRTSEILSDMSKAFDK